MNKKVKKNMLYFFVNITEDIFTVTPCVQYITAEDLNQSRDRPSSRDFCIGIA